MAMESLEQMVVKLVVALAIGLFIGLEREFAGKEAGIRTLMMVSAGSTIFTIVAIALPFIISTPENIPEVIARNSGFLTVIANIAVGIGFLGAGIIIKTDEHVHGLTTAATIWATAAIGVLVGLGLTQFAIVSTVAIVALLYLTRKIQISEKIDKTKID